MEPPEMWVRIDDGFVSHPKILGLSADARWLLLESFCYSARYLTDGQIPKSFAAERHELVKELVAARLWIKMRGGWRIHDWGDYQPSREAVLARREATKKRMAAWRERHGVGNAVTNGVGSSVGNALPVPVPQDLSQDLPANAGEEVANNGWFETPRGWTDQEAGLYRKLFAQNPNWTSLTFAGMNRLNKKHSKEIVTEALRRVYEEGAMPDKPYALIDSICTAIKQQVRLDA